jgi:type IV secretory pathway VirB4 component
VPLLLDVLAHLEGQAREAGSVVAGTLAERLRPFCTGTLAGLFDRPTTLSLDAGLTSFDLEGLDGELRPLAVWTIGNYVWKLAKHDRKKRILCLDEVKTLLEHPESAVLVSHLYALGRAYRLSVWSMSQLLSDYLATPEGERALQNAHTVLLLRQAAGKGAEDAQVRFGLSSDDRRYLEACGRGQGLLVTPQGHVRLQITPSPWELELMGGPSAPAEPGPAEESADVAVPVGLEAAA